MTEKEKPAILSWILYFIIMPISFTAIITIFLLSFMGYDFKQTIYKATNKIPVVSNIIPDPDPESIDDLRVKLEESAEKISEKEVALSKNNKLLNEMDREKQALEAEIESLKSQLAQQQRSEAERLAKLVDIAKLYEGMSAKNAAAVLEQMTVEQAALLLEVMSKKGKIAIFGKFTPNFSASLTNHYLENINYKTISVPLPMLTIMFESVEIEKAVVMFDNMIENEDAFQVAVLFLDRQDEEKRKAYIKAMSKETSKTYKAALEEL